ncbi:hypothetical protein [Lactiplantibacillus carotarum]|uniref:hypothetical protein n=1 Tax=Lactiplantibacillus carotarum TaxID=2993456 RepID=UPI00298EFFF5|nr:hypothetical protein [Lactiplantibacillus carotarum]
MKSINKSKSLISIFLFILVIIVWGLVFLQTQESRTVTGNDANVKSSTSKLENNLTLHNSMQQNNLTNVKAKNNYRKKLKKFQRINLLVHLLAFRQIIFNLQQVAGMLMPFIDHFG